MYKLPDGKPEGKRPFERPRYGWYCTMLMYLEVIGCDFVDYINLYQDEVQRWVFVNTKTNFRLP
jgi:hypothetical protein